MVHKREYRPWIENGKPVEGNGPNFAASAGGHIRKAL
jgi:hypothetical protein